MGKFVDFFTGFKKRYDAQVIRNQKMDEWLNGAHESCVKIDGITNAVNNLSKDVEKISAKVDNLQADVNHINGRLETIGKGTKMELFDTLYNWKKILVDDRGWASEAEKKEVKEIYEVYHDGLQGNGQGKIYFEQIMNLPENPPSNN